MRQTPLASFPRAVLMSNVLLPSIGKAVEKQLNRTCHEFGSFSLRNASEYCRLYQAMQRKCSILVRAIDKCCSQQDLLCVEEAMGPQ